MYISVIILPLISFIIVSIFGRLFGIKGAVIIANLLIAITFLISCIMFYEVNLSGIKENIKLFYFFS